MKSNTQVYLQQIKLKKIQIITRTSIQLPVPGASPGFGRGGGQEFFFQIWEFACREATCAKPCALLGGFGGMLPRENFLKRCNLVRFRVYFDQILSLFFFKKCHFLYKNKYFNTHLLWGISREEIFENLLRLMRFGVYFETKMAIFIKKIIIVYLHSYVLGARGHMLHEKILKIWCSFGTFWCIF